MSSIENITKNNILKILGKDIVDSWDESGMFYIEIRQNSLIRSLTTLSNNNSLLFSMLIDCFMVDHTRKNGRLSIYYILYSNALKNRICVVSDIQEDEHAQSISIIFQNAIWYEREIFDMFGIVFDRNPDMRRILLNYDDNSHPLRKKRKY